MGRWIALALLVSTAALSDTAKQPDPPKGPVCNFPDHVQFSLTVATADTIALSLSGSEHGYQAHLAAEQEYVEQLKELRKKFCK